MQIITKNENKILLLLKNNLEQYPTSIPFDNIRDMFDLTETQIVDILKSLESKNFIHFDEDEKIINYSNLEEDVEIVEDKSALKKYMLNKTEEDAYQVIQNVIHKYDEYAPRYIIEGALLYGELELTPKKTYNIIVSLENKQLLRRVERKDGEYYTL
ncbi:MAG: hypothetical protein E7Z84_03215 [Methanosphaera stadtmanae]|nr:hypothetical protein [Methanosphaera stadtmanae]